VRIVGGKLKGIRLQVPKAFDSRPTTDFAKEGLFNLLSNEFDIDSCDVLDLFTGTGSLSLEFASRDAKSVTAIDWNTACLKFIGEVCNKHKLTQVKLLKNDALKFIQIANIKFDIVVADPPYEYKHYEKMINLVFEKGIMKPGGLLVVEHGKQNNFENLPNFNDVRNYGGVHFSFFRAENNASKVE
jgi:16S rRNA (guanine(966)-N(2))-methyltransferase RsmD